MQLLHCASLIVDDLLCTGTEQGHRHRPALHVRFCEASVIRAAFGCWRLSVLGRSRSLPRADFILRRCWTAVDVAGRCSRQFGIANYSRVLVTPVSEFNGMCKYTVDPVIGPANWRLEITYAELLSLPRTARFVTLRCIGNTLNLI